MNFRSLTCLFLAAISLTMAAGCERGPHLGTVKGQVTMNGTPVPFAYVKFQPIAPRGTYGSAYTDAKGVYSLQFSQTRQGALVGKHNVSVRTSKRDEMEVEDKSTGLLVVTQLPSGYKENMQVQYERDVKSGHNVLDFELSQK
ncbi:hypothetical protein [Schlesneria paludicola]|uniref:hypothetical protein n=1 Tax=Schlesneria paludicola TaxID=360056 RepID=UPI0002F39D26|nr:hypothetical protein [Schlesneria paludicola]